MKEEDNNRWERHEGDNANNAVSSHNTDSVDRDSRGTNKQTLHWQCSHKLQCVDMLLKHHETSYICGIEYTNRHKTKLSNEREPHLAFFFFS